MKRKISFSIGRPQALYGDEKALEIAKEIGADALDEVGYNGVYNIEISLVCFGKGFEIESGELGIKLLRHMFKTRYGKE